MLPKPMYIGSGPCCSHCESCSGGWYFVPRFKKQNPTTSTREPQSADKNVVNTANIKQIIKA
jgi:hypothetical protein